MRSRPRGATGPPTPAVRSLRERPSVSQRRTRPPDAVGDHASPRSEAVPRPPVPGQVARPGETQYRKRCTLESCGHHEHRRRTHRMVSNVGRGDRAPRQTAAFARRPDCRERRQIPPEDAQDHGRDSGAGPPRTDQGPPTPKQTRCHRAATGASVVTCGMSPRIGATRAGLTPRGRGPWVGTNRRAGARPGTRNAIRRLQC